MTLYSTSFSPWGEDQRTKNMGQILATFHCEKVLRYNTVLPSTGTYIEQNPIQSGWILSTLFPRGRERRGCPHEKGHQAIT